MKSVNPNSEDKLKREKHWRFPVFSKKGTDIMIKKTVILWIVALVLSCFAGCVDGGNIEDGSTDSSVLKPIVTDDMSDGITGDITDGNGGDISGDTDIAGDGSVGDNGVGSGDVQVPGNGNGDGNLNGSGNGTGNSAGNGERSGSIR